MARLDIQKAPTLFNHSGSFGANASTAASMPCQGYSTLRGGFRSDIASETASGVRIEQSFDGGLHWDIISTSMVATASAASSFNITLVGNAVRFFWRNGAGAATSAWSNIYLLPIS